MKLEKTFNDVNMGVMKILCADINTKFDNDNSN